MVQIRKIKFEEIKACIKIAFSDDPELISRYHISPGTLDHCVEHTFETVKDTAQYRGSFYKVVFGEEVIGFLIKVSNPNVVLSFGININFRTEAVFKQWFDAIDVLFDHRRYFVAVWSKNIRTIRFFIRNDFNFYITENKIVMLCQ